MRHRLAWILFWSASTAYAVLVVWWLIEPPRPPELNEFLWVLVMVPVPVLAGAYLMWKRPENRIGHLLMTSSVCSYLVLTLFELPTVRAFEASGVQDWMWLPIWLSQTFIAVGLVLTIALLVTLPDGRFRYRPERRLVAWSWLALAFPTLSLISNEHVLTDELSFPGVTDVPSPAVIESLIPYGQVLGALMPLAYMAVLVALLLLFLRYRRASEPERKQVRWVLYGGTVAIVLTLTPFLLSETGIIPPLQHNITAFIYSLPILLLPISIVIAVVQPPWVDVDIVIRKSFVYGALSFLILVLYIFAAASFGVVAAGARLGIEIAVTLTVIVAVLFQPARRRLQMVADRWVFGERPTKYEAVAEFGETIEQTARPEELLPRLVETVRKVIRLTWVTASLDDGTHAESGGVPGQPRLVVPIGVGSDQVGTIRCGPKVSGTFDDDERQLVQTLAAQVGLAVMNARLAGRIVNAAESERRRIERNIHDGAQQELVALVARLGMARANAAHGVLTSATIEELQDEAKSILADLRELAQGIHPSVLSDGGILEAVEERCSRLPIDVSIDAPESLRSMRFHDDVEGAAYFFVSELLANVLKHSGASKVEVTIDRNGDNIELGVVDNGCGFNPDTARKNGLIGLSDRIRALGGTLSVSSDAETGTSVHAMLPTSKQ